MHGHAAVSPNSSLLPMEASDTVLDDRRLMPPLLPPLDGDKQPHQKRANLVQAVSNSKNQNRVAKRTNTRDADVDGTAGAALA